MASAAQPFVESSQKSESIAPLDTRQLPGVTIDGERSVSRHHLRVPVFRQIVLISATLALLSGCGSVVRRPTTDIVSRVDHLVYATPDLDRGIAEIERLLGVRASRGGQHPGRGTRNALAALGPNAYLEIIAPDPDQPPPASPRPFGLDHLQTSRLVTWSANGTDLERLQREAVSKGIALGAVASGSRRRPDGTLLSWRFTDPGTLVADGIIPFFIDWGTSPHPAHSAARGATLVELRAEHPDHQRVQQMLDQLGLTLEVVKGTRPALIAVIDSPRGRVEVR